ncbi:fungal hydrophobin-domain-containing protein [Daedaleopsis nitida]|nr:fungal hydrophobin-domain-containing protein [Daedaleopsis nitida]
MFAKLFTLSALAVLAAATPAPNVNGGSGAGTSGCTTGPIQCCESLQTPNSTAVAPILKGLGIVIQDLNVLVGLTCSAISVIGIGSGNDCNAHTVCCDDNNVGGLLSIGCLPISI